jgi:hypothetical protein
VYNIQTELGTYFVGNQGILVSGVHHSDRELESFACARPSIGSCSPS